MWSAHNQINFRYSVFPSTLSDQGVSLCEIWIFYVRTCRQHTAWLCWLIWVYASRIFHQVDFSKIGFLKLNVDKKIIFSSNYLQAICMYTESKRPTEEKVAQTSGWTAIAHNESQQAYEVYTTSAQHRCNVMTLHRSWDDVVLTSCACWEYAIVWSLTTTRS